MPSNDPKLFHGKGKYKFLTTSKIAESHRQERFSRFPQLFMMEASAGSGKTYSLARRYLQLLINPRLKPEEIPLQAILAITFTNKAALEMKQRILELLKKIALDNFSDQEEKRALIDFLAVGQTQARQKAFLIMEQILKNYNFFQVQTIDSFINTILSGCAFKLDLSANFTTEKQYRQYLILGLDKLIERAHEDKALMGIFHNFLKQYIYLENRPGWFPKEQILSIITALYSQSAKFSGNFLPSSINYTDILKLKEEILKLMRKLQDELPEGTRKDFVKALASCLGKNKEYFDLEEVSDFFRRQDYPLNKGYLIPARVQEIWQQIRGRLKDLAEDESLFAYNYYIEIFNAASSDLKALASRDDILFLEALNKEASGLFQEKQLNLPELYWRLACRYEHFLLDEFQDTSRLQWENLYPMVKEALSSSGSLFFVGDKKQAVYRFRGGDAALIDSVQEEFRGIFSFRQALTKNFRSQRQIVEFNNLIFSSPNLKRFMDLVSVGQKDKDILGEEEKAFVLHEFAAAQQEYMASKSGGYVRVERLEAPKGREKEALAKEKLVSLVKELSLRFNPGDIAILVRKNDDAQKVSSWLLEEGISVESETTLDIRRNAYVKELVSFLRFLNSPIDELAFASFISGDIFSRAAKIENQKIRDFLFDLNRNRQERSYLYREFRQAFPCAWEALLDEFFKNVGFVPLYELAVSILGKFRVFQEFAEYQAYFMGFLELIRLQEDKYSSISEFLDFFEEANSEDLYVNSSSHQAVKVLTIHKSKGLEFPVVVAPFVEINIKIDGQIVILEEQGLKLLYSKARYADFSPRLRKIRSHEYLKGLIDELNAIYVAFTRAAQELYVFVPARGERGANIACMFFPQPEVESGEKAVSPEKTASVAPAKAIPASEYKDWIGLLKDEFMEVGILSQRDKLQRGEALHSILSHIGNLYQQDKEFAVNRALQAAQAQFPLAADFKEYAMIVRELLHKKDLAIYFELAQGEAFTEYEVVNRFGDAKRIDRLVISASQAVVIDYKSDKYASGDHQEQVRGYMSMIREIYPQLKVKGVLLYLDDLSIEEVA